MTLISPPIPHPYRTIEDLIDDLGVPASRILLEPPPGRAMISDVVEIHARTKRLCELVEGTLIEKPMGLRESLIAIAIASYLRAFVIPRKLGVVSGPDGMMNLYGNLIRMPDAAFISWSRFPAGKVPADAAPRLTPDLAVEVLSPSNTPKEMERKRGEYFAAGTQLVWIVNLEARTVEVYTPGDSNTPTTFTAQQTLTAEPVLPGFEMPLAAVFAELDRNAGDAAGA